MVIIYTDGSYNKGLHGVHLLLLCCCIQMNNTPLQLSMYVTSQKFVGCSYCLHLYKEELTATDTTREYADIGYKTCFSFEFKIFNIIFFFVEFRV